MPKPAFFKHGRGASSSDLPIVARAVTREAHPLEVLQQGGRVERGTVVRWGAAALRVGLLRRYLMRRGSRRAAAAGLVAARAAARAAAIVVPAAVGAAQLRAAPRARLVLCRNSCLQRAKSGG